MTANIILLDFSVSPEVFTTTGYKEALQNDVAGVLKEHMKNINMLPVVDLADGFLAIFTGQRQSVITVRAYDKGLVTVNIEYFKTDSDEPLLNLESSSRLEAALGNLHTPSSTRTLLPIQRGKMFDRYLRTSDERILEYDIKQVLYEHVSPFQKIQVFKTMNFGNMLVLDDLQNLAESDIIYTETLMQRGMEDYNGKHILILGGGDGALLHELLKENPAKVTMIEIDDCVMKACREYLRSCCGTCLDSYNGERYEIIVDDCVKKMREYIAEKHTFHYVFADLTDIPLSPTPQGELWDFIRLILNLSMKLLKPDGKYMTHGNGISSGSSLAMFEEQLDHLESKVSYTRSEAFVPSFMELWIFYQIWLGDKTKPKLPSANPSEIVKTLKSTFPIDTTELDTSVKEERLKTIRPSSN